MNKADNAELEADLDYLRQSHGLNEILLESLQRSQEEARAALRFFKCMVFISNCTVMTFGLYLFKIGFGRPMINSSTLELIIGSLGLFLFFWFCFVFTRGVKAAQAAEYVARKHDLI